MKKVLVISLVLITILTFNKKSSEILIPDQAIRFRVIASSNTDMDQDIKMLVKNDVEKDIFNDLSKSSSINETRNIINNNLTKYNKTVLDTLNKNNINQSFNINYGMNYFPEKEYRGIKYKSGNYESLVVTLGEGKGNNWWCVLFPPLCLLDAKEEKDTSKVEYKFFVKELIDKYFK